MRWLITGGCGFIGTALVRHLVEEDGHTVRVYDNLSKGSRDDLAEITPFRETPAGDTRPISSAFTTGGVELVVGDLRDTALSLRVAEGAETIVHLAASTGVETSLIEPRFNCENNIVGALNVLEAARHADARHVVFASSLCAPGERDAAAPPATGSRDALYPVSPNAASKLAGEALCSAYFHSFGIAVTALRLGNVYGPGSHRQAGLVETFIRRALRGDPLEIHGDGHQSRSLVYVEDAVRALRMAAADPRAGQVLEASGARQTTVGELVDLLVPVLKHAGIGEVQVIHGPVRPGDVRNGGRPDAGSVAPQGWRPEIELATGIGRTVRWFMERRRKLSVAA